MTVPAGAPALASGEAGLVWHTLPADRVLEAEGVDGQRGLTSAEVGSRAERSGSNAFDAGKAEPRWRAFIRQYADLMQIVLVMGVGTLGAISWAEQAHTREIAHTMGVVTFSLYALFFSIATGDEHRTVFSLDTFADAKFVIATGVSILTLLLTTVFGPLQKFLQTTSLDVRQWVICLAAALSIVVVSEIRKAVVRRRTVPNDPISR